MHYYHKGHTIGLILSEEGLMWTCQYDIMKFNQTDIAGFPDGNTYNIREEAAAAALVKAKALIDESVPSNHPLDGAFS